MKNFKDKLKGFIAGTLVWSIMLGTVAFAASTKIDVVFDSIKYMFDGVEKKPSSDAKGFIYKGTVYVPVSFFGKSIGKDVSYEGKTKTVWVGKKNGSFKYLESIDYARRDINVRSSEFYFGKWDKDTFKVASNSFSHGIGFDLSSFWYNGQSTSTIDYNLNGTYKSLSGKIGIDDSTKNCVSTGKFTVLGDSSELYVIDNIKGGDLPKDISVDISGVLRLQLKFEITGSDAPDMIFADAKLIQ